MPESFRKVSRQEFHSPSPLVRGAAVVEKIIADGASRLNETVNYVNGEKAIQPRSALADHPDFLLRSWFWRLLSRLLSRGAHIKPVSDDRLSERCFLVVMSGILLPGNERRHPQ